MKKGFACQEEEEAESEYFKEHLKGGKEELEAWQYVCVCVCVRCDISLIIILFVLGKLRN